MPGVDCCVLSAGRFCQELKILGSQAHTGFRGIRTWKAVGQAQSLIGRSRAPTPQTLATPLSYLLMF